MKKARLTVRTFEVTCPYCGELSTDDDYDSHMWDWDAEHAGSVHTCSECGEQFSLPAIVADNRLKAAVYGPRFTEPARLAARDNPEDE